ncbi:GH15 family glucan-1,4-alpha-glucosidase [Rhodoligotrophos appendicifer]|uniref:glycoside hydrolase family 15 protein n=1 Tax=Rhodoligotrophos appendicifer TaxID=987056 RepID=UPI001184AE1F|nr:glycoside hydrolase family 15 protein [Rhodoligotrophos appendicifer]
MLIEDYAIIGNMISAALVSKNGSIDWLCLPRFDSPACFAALLGTRDNGHWSIRPTEKFTMTRHYVPDTAVLETHFQTATGTIAIFDFMPLTDDEDRVDLVRLVKGLHGTVDVEMELVLRFNYGQAVPWVRRRDYGMSAIAGPDAVALHTPVPLEGQQLRTMARFTVKKGEKVPFTLSYHHSHKTPHFVPDRQESLDATTQWWREWSARAKLEHVPDRLKEAVLRSLITLKLLTYSPTGGIVAAPTTSLPELIGGARNWDYRYCWIRDSTLTLYALLNAGYREEAEAWRQWLLRAAAGHPEQLHIMYGIDGRRWLPESELPWLKGFQDSRPVRIGNAASHQVQLDVFGELIDVLHAAHKAELASIDDSWRVQKLLLSHLEKVWQEPDYGIWEVRGEARRFTHSQLMCWVAYDRAIKTADTFKLSGPVEKWRVLRELIKETILERGFDTRRNSFVQSFDSQHLDASLLLVPQVGFLKPNDPRVVGTVAAIERELLQNGFVQRYSTDHVDDGVGGSEGAFLACSFWLADAYVMQGRLEEATELFERSLTLRNDVGLLAEEYDPIRKQLVGNFPQSFSHVGLVNTAFNLSNAYGPARQRSKRDAPTKHTTERSKSPVIA